MDPSLGQFFTTDLTLKTKICDFIQNSPSMILEPSIGRGDLVLAVKNRFPTAKVDMYEIDERISLLDPLERKEVIYSDFLTKEVSTLYQSIVGNPPYVKTKTRNLYLDFTEKCLNLLSPRGELVFIVPSDFFKLTSARSLLNKMMSEGCFTDIYHPHDEKLFSGASIDVVVYRYCKDPELPKKVRYNDEVRDIVITNGLITFETQGREFGGLISDYFDVYVGMVSGKESVFKNLELGELEVLNGKNTIDRYIFVKEFPSGKRDLDKYLLSHKEELLARRIRKFNENNWFEWGAVRNLTKVNESRDKDCIYVKSLTRQKEVAFLGKVMEFGGSLLMMVPRSNCDLDLSKVVSFLNSEEFRENYTFSNRFKIGQRQLANSHL